MAETASTFRLEPGASAPEFALPDRTGLLHRPDTLVSGKRGLLVVFACNHCPYVVHLADALGRFADGIASRGVATVAIASNDADRYPQDGPDRLTDFAESHGWEFPYLHDATQEVAHAYAAACTPDFYLFDAGLSLVYAGQFDDSRPGKGFPTGSDLARAVDNLLSGRETPPPLVSQHRLQHQVAARKRARLLRLSRSPFPPDLCQPRPSSNFSVESLPGWRTFPG